MEHGAMPTSMRLIIIVVLVLTGAAIVRNVTGAMQGVVFGDDRIVAATR